MEYGPTRHLSIWAVPLVMRLTLRICITLLLLAAVAKSQQPMTQTVPATPRPRPHRVVHPQPHLDDPWFPDPPPEGFTPQPAPAAQQAGSVSGAAPAVSPAAAPQPAPVQPTMYEALPPPVPPEVAFRNGQLTVRAINSTLESVLIAIRNKAGIQFEGLEGAPERVAISMGPSPEGEVLTAILAGSHYDFVVMERPDSPGIVQRVLLSPRRGTASAAAPGMAGTQPPQRAASGDEEENPDETSAEAESPQDTPARPPIMQAQPQMQINPQPPQPQPAQQPTGAKTPEQLLEELKQMQQRQQQQQQPPPQQQAPLKQPPL